MKRIRKKKWTRKKVMFFRILVCIIVLVGGFTIIRGTLFWGTVAARAIDWWRSRKPVEIIASAIALLFALLTAATTIWSFFFGTPNLFPGKDTVRKRLQKAFIAATLFCACYVPFHALDQFGFAQWMIDQEQDSLDAVEKFLDDTTPAAADAEGSSMKPDLAGPSLSQYGIAADPYQRLSAEQHSLLFYTSAVGWYDLDAALQRRSFYTVETQLLHGAFPNLESAVREAVHACLAQQTTLYTPALTVRVRTPEGKGECSLLEAMDACDEWDAECGDSADLEECLAQHRYIQRLYRDHPCERLARLYADICFRVQERLSEPSEQAVDGEVLLYYIAEEIAAYEVIYRHTRSWQVFEELTGAYSRIAASGLVAYGDRLRALVLAHTDLPPDCL